jgi:hypothetical protein
MSELQRVTYSHEMLRRIIDLVHGKTTHEITANDIVNELNNDIELLDQLYELNKNKKVRNWTINRGFTATGLVALVKQFGYSGWKDFRVKESIHNHRIAKIEYLDEKIPVGTLTIDGDELYHDYHTFALSCGVFTKNSSLGQIDDLKYFNNKMARGLRVPSSYLPTGPDDSDRAMEDGRVGTALIQEYRFNQYCERLQNLIMQKLDDEFKMFMKWRGFNIDSGLFNIKFNPPQNFASYRQTELDSTRIAAFVQLEPLAYMSKRFLLERYLGLTREEMLQNEKMWREEKGESQMETEGKEMRSVGATPGSFEADSTSAEQMEIGDAAGFGGAESMEMAGGGETTAMAGAPPPAPGPVV